MLAPPGKQSPQLTATSDAGYGVKPYLLIAHRLRQMAARGPALDAVLVLCADDNRGSDVEEI